MARASQPDAQHLTERANRQPPKPAVGRELAGQHELGGASVGINPAHAATLEDRVRRWANRHDCQAPAKLQEAIAEGWLNKAAHITSNPAAFCSHPRHGEDATWLAETLELLGLRATIRKRGRSNSISAKPNNGNGRCAHCGYKQQLRINGTVMAHDRDGERCPGTGEKPKAVEEP